MKRYTGQVNYIPANSQQPVGGFGINCMANNVAEAKQEMTDAGKAAFPTALVVWVDSCNPISDEIS